MLYKAVKNRKRYVENFIDTSYKALYGTFRLLITLNPFVHPLFTSYKDLYGKKPAVISFHIAST